MFFEGERKRIEFFIYEIFYICYIVKMEKFSDKVIRLI
ncbi:hypothetical protein BREVNS_0201 [Brevinematales bacterium NS]|nr:hypothetical protein BREVNS_0201 [Brevinematales bacterium NS]